MRPCRKEKAKGVMQSLLPITTWLPTYNLAKLQCDIIAGVTVGLTVIPQALAYAWIAGLPIEYGLYSSFMGCFVYCFFGTSKDVTIGPAAIISFLVDDAVYNHLTASRTSAVPYAIMLSLLCGIIQLVMGLLRLGFLVEFISIPVISGFTSAAAITIGFGQVKNILGLHDIPKDFTSCVKATFQYIGETNIWDLILGLCCIALLLSLRKMNQFQWSKPWEVEHLTMSQKVGRKIIWCVTTGRNALTILVAMLVAIVVESHGHPNTFKLTGSVKEGFPPFKVPSLTTHEGNRTVTSGEMLKQLGPGLVVIPLICFLESIAIAKAFARKNKYRVDPSQELIALGIANCMSSFVSSYPVTGSFSRTAVNAQSGVATPAGGIFTGAIVLLALGILTPFFKYIPISSLAALIITSVLTMVEYRIIKKIWNVKKIDLVSFLVTFFGCFYKMVVGILCGMGVSLMVLLYPVVWPRLIGVQRGHACTLLRINGGISFPGIEHVATKIQELSFQEPKPTTIVVDFSLITEIDFSVTQGLLMIIEDLENKNISIQFIRVHDNIRDVMADSGIDLALINQNLQNITGSGHVNSDEINPV